MAKLVCSKFRWGFTNFKHHCSPLAKQPIITRTFPITYTKLKCCAHLYPQGLNDYWKDYVSVYIELENEEREELMVKLDFWIGGADKSRKSTGFIRWTSQFHGFPDFIKRRCLFNSKNDILVNDVLLLYVQICVTSKSIMNSPAPALDYKQDKERRCPIDVKFKIQGRSFKAHKLALMVRCKKFMKMFTDSKKTEFEIDDVPVELMHDFLQYIYTGKVNAAGLKLMDFWKVMCRYELQSLRLQRKFEDKLVAQISNENAIELFEFGYDCHFEQLCNVTFEHIVKNYETILNSESYNKLMTFLKIVRIYNLGNLKLQDTCAQKLIAKVNNENVVELFEFGYDCEIESVYNHCYNHIHENFRIIVHSESYKKLKKSKPHLASSIMDSIAGNRFGSRERILNV